MNILINEEEREIAENSTISQMMERLDIEIIKGIALAVNDEVVPKTQWDHHLLYQNDNILLITSIACFSSLAKKTRFIP